MKKIAVAITVLALLLVSGCASTNGEVTTLQGEVESLNVYLEELRADLTEAKNDASIYKNANVELEKQIAELEEQNAELEEKVEEAEPWFKLSAEEKAAKEAELAAIEEQKRLEAEAEAEAARKAAEEEAKKGYNTGITYNQLARTPDDYEGKKVKFSGKVLQVMEGDGYVTLRIAVNNDYDTVLYCIYDASIVDFRVLEDDKITVYGISAGLYSYQSTGAGTITIPSMVVEKIDQ